MRNDYRILFSLGYFLRASGHDGANAEGTTTVVSGRNLESKPTLHDRHQQNIRK